MEWTVLNGMMVSAAHCNITRVLWSVTANDDRRFVSLGAPCQVVVVVFSRRTSRSFIRRSPRPQPNPSSAHTVTFTSFFSRISRRGVTTVIEMLRKYKVRPTSIIHPPQLQTDSLRRRIPNESTTIGSPEYHPWRRQDWRLMISMQQSRRCSGQHERRPP